MASPNTIRVYDLDGSVDFPVAFDYLARRFVVVTLLGVDRKELVQGSDYTFLTDNMIRLAGTLDTTGYSTIEVKRVTSTTERLVVFNDASILTASDLNLSDMQVIHIAEEGRDIASDSLGSDDDGNLDARGRRLVNMSNPVNPQDSVTKNYVDTTAASVGPNAALAAASATAAAASQSAAAGSATSASNSASAAAASAAAALASQTAAAGSATSAGNSASAASLSATTAGNAQVAASNSATNAAASEAAAAASAASVDASNIVHRTGAETVGGVKTFTSSPKIPSGVAPDEPVTMGQLSAAIPPGFILARAADVVPAGWLACDGTAVSRTTYAALFAVIGTSAGPGDGSTTFNVPDLRGEFVRGLDKGRGVDANRAIGTSQASQNLAHNHSAGDVGHSHSYATLNPFTRTGELAGSGSTGYMVSSRDFNGYNTDTGYANIIIGWSGGTEARPRNVAYPYMIKT